MNIKIIKIEKLKSTERITFAREDEGYSKDTIINIRPPINDEERIKLILEYIENNIVLKPITNINDINTDILDSPKYKKEKEIEEVKHKLSELINSIKEDYEILSIADKTENTQMVQEKKDRVIEKFTEYNNLRTQLITRKTELSLL